MGWDLPIIEFNFSTIAEKVKFYCWLI